MALATFIGVSTINAPATSANVLDSTESSSIEATTPKILGYFKVTSTIGANVRSGPGTQYSIIGVGNYGQDLLFWGDQKRDSSGTWWYQVQANNGRVGWISGETGYLF